MQFTKDAKAAVTMAPIFSQKRRKRLEWQIVCVAAAFVARFRRALPSPTARTRAGPRGAGERVCEQVARAAMRFGALTKGAQQCKPRPELKLFFCTEESAAQQ